MKRLKKSELSYIVRTAIETCNHPDLKKEILCAPGSDYDRNKTIDVYNTSFYSKTTWNELIEKKAAVLLENVDKEEHLKKKVIGFVLLIGMRMLTWAEYHEGTLGFSREFSVNFLNGSFFTDEGIIDNKKVAKELIKHESLSIEQKFKLASLYCFVDHIELYYKQVTKEEEFYDAERPERIKQPQIVKFWYYYHKGELYKLRDLPVISVHKFKLKSAILSGCIAAVRYCLEETRITKMNEDNCFVIYAAVKVVCYRVLMGPCSTKDRIVFRNTRYNDRMESWVPSNYYVDILCYLISKMEKSNKIEFLKDITKILVRYKVEFTERRMHYFLLESFLRWPYQSYFMETVELMWKFLPEIDYAVLLVRICNMIELKENHFMYGEEKSFDYRELLKEFWSRSPERYKRFVISNRQVDCCLDRPVVFQTGVQLLMDLVTLKNFTNEDNKNIKLVLESANSEDKKNILLSNVWRKKCFNLIQKGEWKTLNRFVLKLSKEEAKRFKRELILSEEGIRICRDIFKRNGNWNAVESLIKWSTLVKYEINKLKTKMICNQTCLDLLSHYKNVEVVDKFIEWCLSSAEAVKAFRKELVFSDEGILKCARLIVEKELELANEFLNFCLSSKEEVRKLKKDLANQIGNPICIYYISGETESHKIRWRTEFRGGNWKEVDKFLTWCFSSEEEINDFKKNKLREETIVRIHFNLIKCNQWEEAEKLFAWLELSTEKINEVKTNTLCSSDGIKMFCEIMYSHDDEKLHDYGNKQKAMEVFLRWSLTDKEAALAFRHHIMQLNKDQFHSARSEVREKFELAINCHLNYLTDEQRK